MKKHINSATEQYQDGYTDNWVLDDTPTEGSFNGVTSDGVAKAIAGASGEVPVIGDGDNGKVLKAVVDGSSKSVEWGDDSVDLVSNGGLEKDSSGALGVKVDNSTVSINESGALQANLAFLYSVLNIQEHMPSEIPYGYIRIQYRSEVPYNVILANSTLQKDVIKYADQPSIIDIPSSRASYKSICVAEYPCDILGGVLLETTSGSGKMVSLYQCTGIKTARGLSLGPGVTNSNGIFQGCTGLESVEIDTTGLTNAVNMFSGCTALQSIPQLNTATLTAVGGTGSTAGMFRGCTAVESGALALYQQMSTQATPPTTTANCFTDCGSGTVTGVAELAQIPASWGGTGEG